MTREGYGRLACDPPIDCRRNPGFRGNCSASCAGLLPMATTGPCRARTSEGRRVRRPNRATSPAQRRRLAMVSPLEILDFGVIGRHPDSVSTTERTRSVCSKAMPWAPCLKPAANNSAAFTLAQPQLRSSPSNNVAGSICSSCRARAAAISSSTPPHVELLAVVRRHFETFQNLANVDRFEPRKLCRLDSRSRGCWRRQCAVSVRAPYGVT